jgi:hypothetical protein
MQVTPIGKKFGRYAPGDTFTLPDKAARALIIAGKLREASAQDGISPRTGLPKRQYRRRDMRAED